ncbi:hypothetical protein GCM10022403_034630 [Streptomyces coacervatus]|uniref:Cupin type-2 domain-containing protein n=1 Tax=Streptomyces coacervatus TaxID=647381 RepID=A0ABP7HMZ3_9ACTN|nr:cupin domain-containing protein [Streptomyces coacervatus]MDF2272063.1 cupin domain-containing protein [Streptomyces coacervatus]
MPNELLLADLALPSAVYGVHGAPGLTQWRSLASGTGLRGPYEAVEWACVPPGGLSGEHLHSRTEEVYVLLTGEGEALLNGRPQPVRAGEVILTGLGATHGLRNTGPDALSWLTIEIPAPRTVRLAHSLRKDATPMPLPDGKATIINLQHEKDVDPRCVLQGPLNRIRLLRLAPGQSEQLPSHGTEHTVFVLAGEATATAHSREVPIRKGMAVTTSGGESLCITAATEGFEAVCASFEILRRHHEGELAP